MTERQVVIKIAATDAFSTVLSKYNQAIGKAATDTQKLSDTSDKAARGGLTGLNNTLNNVMGVFAGMQFLKVAGDLVEVGTKANMVDSTFKALSGTAQDYVANMNMMRAATGNVVDDMELQSGASKLFSMQLADSGEAASKMAAVAIKLSQAMGEMDPGAAIENFALMLSNNSLLRLDTLGISASRVRERMKELAEEFPELDRNARFVKATMEEAEKTMNRLGDSANAGVTPLARFQTAIKNAGQDIGQFLTDNLNTAINTAETLGKIIGTIQTEGLGNVMAAANGTNLRDVNRDNLRGRIAMQQDVQQIYDTIVRDFNGGANSDFILDFIVKALEETRNNPALKNNTDELARTVMNDLISSGKTYEDYNADLTTTMAIGVIQIGATNDALRDQKQAAMDAAAGFYALDEAYAPVKDPSVNQELQNRNALIAQNAIAARDFYATDEAFAPTAVANIDEVAQARVAAMKTAMVDARNSYDTTMQHLYTDTSDALATLFSNQGGLQAGMESALGDPLTMMKSLTDFQLGDIPDFLRPEQAAALAKAYSDVEAEFEHLKELHDQKLITDDDLANAEVMKDNLGKMADEAKRASDNLQNLTLGQALGQTNGGIVGSITDDLVKQWKEQGNTNEQIAEKKKALDMASGRETLTSTAYQEQVVPMLANMTPEDAAKAAENIEAFMKMAAQLEMTDEEKARLLPGATGFKGGGAGQGFTIQPGQTPGEIAAMLGIPVEQVIAATGAPSARSVQPGSYNLGGGYTPTQGFDVNTYLQNSMGGQGESRGNTAEGDIDPVKQMSDLSDKASEFQATTATTAEDLMAARDETDKIKANFDALTAQPQRVAMEVEIQWNDQSGFLKLLGKGIQLQGTVGTNVRDNGGRVNGVDSRVGQKPTLG